MPKLTDKQHSIYMTHSGKSFIKILSKKLYPNDYHWFVLFDVHNHIYTLSFWDILLKDKLQNKIDTSKSYSFTSYDDLHNFILNYAPSVRCIALDSNLDSIAGEKFSRLTHYILEYSKCTDALLFTATPPCIVDTQQYVANQHELKPPFSLKRAQVTTMENLRSNTIDFVSINHGCWSYFFSFFSYYNQSRENQSSGNWSCWKGHHVSPEIIEDESGLEFSKYNKIPVTPEDTNSIIYIKSKNT